MSSEHSSDSGRWLGGIELGNDSDSTEASTAKDNIGPISVSSQSFPYLVQHLQRQLVIQADQSRVLSLICSKASLVPCHFGCPAP